MNRPTVLRWCPRSYSYVLQDLSNMPPVHPPLVGRLPSISSLENSQPDPRPLEFHHLLFQNDIAKAQLFLDKRETQLSLNALEEYSQALISRGGEIPQRLRASDRLPYILRGLRPAKTTVQSVEDVLDCKLSQWKRPWCTVWDELDADSRTSFEKNYTEENIQRHECLRGWLPEPALHLRNRWATIIRYRPLGKPFTVLDHIKDRIPLVIAHYLAELVVDMSTVTFPKSIASICREVAFRLEDELLSKLAHLEGIGYWYTGSEYLWGILSTIKWSDKDRLVIGAHYLKSALKACKFNRSHPSTGQVVERPAFWHTWYMDGVSKRGICRINRELVNQIRLYQHGKISSTQVPLLVRPGPYASRQDLVGGLRCSPGLLSSGARSQEQQIAIEKAMEVGSMRSVIKSVEALGDTAWRINSNVLKVIKSFLEKSQTIGDVPSMPSDAKTRENIEKAAIFRRYKDAIKVAEILSKNGHRFYERHYLDFRGRCYPHTGSSLTHMSSDSLRALFDFWEGRPLGKSGMFWLKVHLANVYGVSRTLSFHKRVNWVDVQLENIIGSAQDPLGNKWWQEAEKPFQSLRACFELKAALEAGDSESFISHISVAQDGSCNGLQHLVALSKDESLAPYVNLMPRSSSEGPGDIYSMVANSVGVSRSLIKKPIMTTFYGASRHTISEILRDELGPRTERVAKSIRDKLDELGEGAWAIYEWLSEMAYRISHSARGDMYTRDPELIGKAWYTSVSWTTPLGLPIAQPYVDPGLIAVRTHLQAFYCKSPYHQAKVDTQKQRISFPPNYIHSLDAAHMQLTALRAQKANISFAAVHDSFWTHAGDMDTLRRLLRQAFVQLHEKSQIKLLLEEWKQRYAGFWQLAFLHQSSPIYEKVRWLRNGKMGNPLILRNELDLEYTNQFGGTTRETPWTIIKNSGERIRYENGVPHLGLTGQVTRAWIPLLFDPVPPARALDIEKVLQSEYFFH